MCDQSRCVQDIYKTDLVIMENVASAFIRTRAFCVRGWRLKRKALSDGERVEDYDDAVSA